MSYKLHHVGLYSSDYASLHFTFCQLLGHSEGRSEELFGVNALFLTQDTCDLQLAIFRDKPIHPWFGDAFGISYIAFEVEDLRDALTHLRAEEVELVEAPAMSSSYLYAVIKSVEGLPIVLLERERAQIHNAAAVDEPTLDTIGNPFEFTLTHTAVLTEDLDASEAFWSTNFDLHRFSGNYCEESGFVALTDAHWQPERHTVFLELLCPPNVLNVDQYGYDRAGVSYFHLSYYANDVDAAWQHLVDNGMHPTLQPYTEAGTGAEDSFVLGIDHIAIEIFGGSGAEEVLELPDIRTVDETFSVSAAEMTSASGPMTIADDFVFNPPIRGKNP